MKYLSNSFLLVMAGVSLMAVVIIQYCINADFIKFNKITLERLERSENNLARLRQRVSTLEVNAQLSSGDNEVRGY